MLSFGNPLGFWTLLALPPIIAIHFLQRESRRLTISTLFLLKQLAPESARGRRFERFRNSVPLWLQILAALLVTWLMVQPRWLRSSSVQHVVLIVDSSVSMSAFATDLVREVEKCTGRFERAAAKTEWQLLESDISRPPLYAGSDRSAVVAALKSWKPHLGTHDFAPGWQLGQSLLRGSGTLIFVTDRPCEAPEGVRLLAIGRPLENCGFAGTTVSGRKWQTLVKNYGRTPQKRSWWMESKGQRSPSQELTLSPGQTTKLSGEIPEGTNSCELVLSSDDFRLDDRLPIVAPEPKRLALAIQANSLFNDFFQQFSRSLEATQVVTSKPDVQLVVYDPFSPRLPEGTAIVFVADPEPPTTFLSGTVTAENDPLTAELNWSGLLCRDTLKVPAKPNDRPLVWQEGRPLVFVRENGSGSLLVINFDIRASNANRLPAFVLLLQRFTERARTSKVAPETRNVDTNQPLNIAADRNQQPPTISGENSFALSAPSEPTFFDVKQGNTVLLHAAAQFADAREADFRDAAFSDGTRHVEMELTTRNSEADFLAPVWVLAMGAAMIGSWTWRD